MSGPRRGRTVQRTRWAFALVALVGVAATAAASVGNFLVTNNDVPQPNPPKNYRGSTVTFYSIGAQGALTNRTVRAAGGDGIAGGTFAYTRVVTVAQGADVCVFSSNAGTADIAAFSAATRTLLNNYLPSESDAGASNGIGLAANGSYLYAAYSTSSTLVTFQIGAGCALSYVSSLRTLGLNGGVIGGMALQGAMLVATYGDGSIASFNISAGAPQANGDEQLSTGAASDYLPNGVTLTADGHFAIFGDASTQSTVEVSDVSSGKLKPTVVYNLGTGWNSGNVQLSPSGSWLFVTNSSGGQVTAAFFNKTTGQVRAGCSTGVLNGFYDSWSYAGGAVLQLGAANNGFVFVPEFGSGFSSIGIVQMTVHGQQCTLAELASSPRTDDTDASSLLSLAAYIAD
jgi:hypothetical protein